MSHKLETIKILPELTYNKRGQLVYDNHTFSGIAKAGPGNCVYWKCSFYKRTRCKVVIKTRGKEWLDIKGEHNHEPLGDKLYQPKLWTEADDG